MNQLNMERREPRNVVRLNKGQDVPEGAKRLTEDEVLRHHLDMVHKWKKPSEVWPFRLGAGIIGASAALSGLFINNHYRMKFNLGNVGRVATYLPAVCLPAMMSSLVHQLMVANKVLAGNYTCTVCIETRSGAFSAALGLVYPWVISPISCIIMARRYYTIPVPTTGGKLFNFFTKTSPAVSGMLILAAAQFALGMFIAERQITVFQNVLMKSWNDGDMDKEGY